MTNFKTSRSLLLILYAGTIAGTTLAIDWSSAGEFRGLLVLFGKSAGLMAFVMLVLQAAMTCRVKLLDRLAAIDKVTNFHKRMGIVVACLLIAHVALLVAGKNNLALLSMETSWRVNLGKAALGMTWLTVTLAMTFGAFGLDYNIWRVSHKTALAIVGLGFLHSWSIGAEVRYTPLRFVWWGLLLVCAAAAVYRNGYIPLWGRRRYRVKAVSRQTHNTYTLTLGAEQTPIRTHKPGQFIFLKLKRPGRKSEIHPFTLASSPAEAPSLQVTIKQSGNFTNTIDQTTTADTAMVEGPYGQFSLVNYPAGPVLLIAGGVGITPLMSMMRYLRDTGDRREVVFLYGNRTRDDILFEKELAALPANFKVVHVLSEADAAWTGLKGYITQEIIGEHIRSMPATTEIFLCGPPPMMDKVIGSLRALEIAGGRIHYERFTL